MSLQGDAVGGVTFLLIYDFGVDLCCGDVFVGEHLRYGIYVSAVGYQKCSVGVAQAMESDRLCKGKQTGEDKT